MSRVLAYTVTRADTPERARLWASTVTSGRDTADYGFDWHVFVPRGTLGHHYCESALPLKLIDRVIVWERNMGQHVATRDAHREAIDGGYDYVLRLDDDCRFLTRRWLAKLIESSQRLDDKMVLSPVVRGLRNRVPQSQTVEVHDVPLRILEGAVGGICRLIPTALLKEHSYVSDVRQAMGAGDATGIGKWCMKNLIPMAYLTNVRVQHVTDEQERDDPMHFSTHDLFQLVPYVPDWSPA